ncbi:response regulator [Shouchella shacheensis]|uniref:response regulator n=1 Tax=Shouchella shacheensis TaxID=1649580 RepID=UPI0007403C0D|nr:response regulator [Shouchella shacheensis]
MYQLLLVDDEEATLQGLQSLPWKDMDFSSVYLARSAREALSILEQTEIDVMVSDIRMPGKLGTDLLKEVHDGGHQVKALLLSGYAEFSYATDALRAKAVDYLLKPVADEELLDAVSRALQLKLEVKKAETRSHLELGGAVLRPWLEEGTEVGLVSFCQAEGVAFDTEALWLRVNMGDHGVEVESKQLRWFEHMMSDYFQNGRTGLMTLKEGSGHYSVLLYQKTSTPPVDWEAYIRHELTDNFLKTMKRTFAGPITVKLSRRFLLGKKGAIVYRQMKEKSREPLSAAEQLVSRVQHYVYTRLEEHPNLQSVADDLQLHAAYVSKVYKEVTGENFTDYIHRTRMERAVFLLNETNEKIAVIAKKLGYGDSSYFIKVFKKYFNVTPQEFRSG